MFAIDFENLQRDVAPAVAIDGDIGRRPLHLIEQDHTFANANTGSVARRRETLQAQGLGIEGAMPFQVSHFQTNADLSDAGIVGRHHGDAISIRISQGAGLGQACLRNQQFAIPRRSRHRDRRFVRINLQYRPKQIVTMLNYAAADGQGVIESGADGFLPETRHWFDAVRRRPNVEAILCQVHELVLLARRASIAWLLAKLTLIGRLAPMVRER
jgi:hypothetical protein